jgi:phosphoglycerate dehydrogenase-like enzyme
MSKILITDSFFVDPDKGHFQPLADAGFSPVHINELKPSDDDLKAALQDGVVGYILGGIEHVTPELVAAAPDLKAISFTGTAFRDFIPGWQEATHQGIAISAARGRNADSVAEWILGATLALLRQFPNTTARDQAAPGFVTARELKALTIGIVGYGHVGRVLRKIFSALGARVVVTDSQAARDDFATVLTLEEIVATADVISVNASQPRGVDVINASVIEALRPGTILVNAGHHSMVDNDALVKRMVAEPSIKAALDYPLEEAVDSTSDLSPYQILSTQMQTAFNTAEANDRVGRRVVEAMLGLLTVGSDPDLVNPEFREYR